MQKALLLVDLQNDFLNRPGLLPAVKDLTGPISTVLSHARSTGMPVAHVRTRVEGSGRDRMPHWRKSGVWQCLAGTIGEETPDAFAALAGEPVFYKQFFSGFGNPGLDEWLRATGIQELWLAGVYTHGCIRSTVLDAYQRGYRVTVVEDGVADNDPLHGRISRDYLDGRAASFELSSDLLRTGQAEDVHFSPVRPEREVVRCRRSPVTEIDDAVQAAKSAGEAWSRQTLACRRNILKTFADRLCSVESQWLEWMVRDLGKPRRDAVDEFRRAHGHLAAALQLADQEPLDRGATVYFRPHGVVAIITPWNNPVAIPAGKLAAALLLGNGVVWKPAFQADNISRNLFSLLRDCGLPDGLVQLVNGGPAEVARLVAHKDVAAVSLTGPEQAGSTVSAICRPQDKPLQAELGGNNAMLVLADADLPEQVSVWARMAYGFAGQRCTALRRFVVERSAVDRFEARMTDAIRALQLHDPDQPGCDVGPLISTAQVQRVQAAVVSALGRGGRLLTGNPDVRPCTKAGCYFEPALLADLKPDDPLVQEELFGPVAVIQVAEDFEHGLSLVNGVRQGLLAGIATNSTVLQDAFAERVEAGIVIDGKGMRIHPGAPFGGRKASQIGPPEHGIWDRQFFSRVQTRYGSVPEC